VSAATQDSSGPFFRRWENPVFDTLASVIVNYRLAKSLIEANLLVISAFAHYDLLPDLSSLEKPLAGAAATSSRQQVSQQFGTSQAHVDKIEESIRSE